jgi:hypothetical protein
MFTVCCCCLQGSLLDAARSGDVDKLQDTVQGFLDAGVSVSCRDGVGAPCVHSSSHCGSECHHSVRQGAITLLEIAVVLGVALLLEGGAICLTHVTATALVRNAMEAQAHCMYLWGMQPFTCGGASVHLSGWKVSIHLGGRKQSLGGCEDASHSHEATVSCNYSYIWWGVGGQAVTLRGASGPTAGYDRRSMAWQVDIRICELGAVGQTVSSEGETDAGSWGVCARGAGVARGLGCVQNTAKCLIYHRKYVNTKPEWYNEVLQVMALDHWAQFWLHSILIRKYCTK